MSLEHRSVVTIDDLSNGEIEGIFSLTDEVMGSMGKQYGLCQGKVMASLFFEPSTRTRLSFETAMHRLGGHVMTVVGGGSTSLAKGETIADMARVVGSYADIIVIRHPWEGAAKVVADYAGIPVINAGDGSHEHPTQTLCDLYTIRKERKTINNLRIALWGDLKNGRTIHSLTYALARFGANIIFRPGTGLEMPDYVRRRLSTEYKGKLETYDANEFDSDAKQKTYPLDAIYLTPSKPHQPALIPSVAINIEMNAGIDAIYVTRLQTERISRPSGVEQVESEYPKVTRDLLNEKKFEKAIVMHPLPRVDELPFELDSDSRSMYFKQAALGVPVRMALLSLILGVRGMPSIPEGESFSLNKVYPAYKKGYGVKCINPKCVTVQETEKKYIKPEFWVVSQQPLVLRCAYCEHETHPKYVARAESHAGKISEKKYHPADSHWARDIKADNLIIFDSAEQAHTFGYEPDTRLAASG